MIRHSIRAPRHASTPCPSHNHPILKEDPMKLLLAGAIALGIPALAAADEIQWAKDYASAVEAAKKSNRLIMVDFYTDW